MTPQEIKMQIEALQVSLQQLRIQTKANLQASKELERVERAAKIAQVMNSAELAAPKVNLTEKIRQLMKCGLTDMQMAAELGVTKKAIIDRRWRVEKALGLR